MVKKLMGINNPDVFNDEIGQHIKIRLMNYALDKYKGHDLKDIENSINSAAKIIEIAREAIVERLKAESEVLTFKQYMGDEVPMLFIAGVLHALDTIEGKGSVIAE